MENIKLSKKSINILFNIFDSKFSKERLANEFQLNKLVTIKFDF